jgi:acyl carrier protein
MMKHSRCAMGFICILQFEIPQPALVAVDTLREGYAMICGTLLKFRNLGDAYRKGILIAHLRYETSSILGFDLAREIELERGLFDLGMDSLMAVELKGRLERTLAVPLPSTLTFNYPTIEALVDFLLKDALGFDSAPAQEKTIPTSAPAKAVSADHPSDDLSEDELSVLLMKKLEQMK